MLQKPKGTTSTSVCKNQNSSTYAMRYIHTEESQWAHDWRMFGTCSAHAQHTKHKSRSHTLLLSSRYMYIWTLLASSKSAGPSAYSERTMPSMSHTQRTEQTYEHKDEFAFARKLTNSNVMCTPKHQHQLGAFPEIWTRAEWRYDHHACNCWHT
jgi:hypothetical protein